MNANQILWHFRCEFVRSEGLYEQGEQSYYVPGYGSSKGYTNSYTFWRLTSKGHDFINSTYYKITQVYNVEIDKDEYRKYLEQPRVSNPWKKQKHSPWRNWRDRRNKPQKYVKKPHHKKKELSEQESAKREWKKKKKRNKGRKAYWKRVSPYFKVVNKKKHRSYERDLMAKERYDDLHDKTWRKEDIWGWD